MAKSKRTKILDAAEALFASDGLKGASLRNIARDAGVDVSLITYHFKTKNRLFDAVIARRTEVFNREQNLYLEEVERRAAPGRPELEDVVDAYCYVFLKWAMSTDEAWRQFFRLFTRLSNDPGIGVVVMEQFFDPIAKRTLRALREALPECGEDDLHWAFQFMHGALITTLVQTGSVNRLSGGRVDSEDYRKIHSALVEHACAGFRALCGDRQVSAVRELEESPLKHTR